MTKKEAGMTKKEAGMKKCHPCEFYVSSPRRRGSSQSVIPVK
ncbi:MAG: hypothetical protein SFT93_04765 [Rickettsiaceae bacterium]|nr:hypothetical protein [Rickettsiaceae bacterium]